MSYGGPNDARVQRVFGNVPHVPGGAPHVPVNMPQIMGNTVHLLENVPASTAFIEDSMPPPLQVNRQTFDTKRLSSLTQSDLDSVLGTQSY